MADAKPFSTEEIKNRHTDLEHKKALIRASTGSKHILDFVDTLEDRYLATIVARDKTIERLRGELQEADELLQRHDAGQLHNDHYKGHVLQKDTVAFFARQALGKEE